MLDVHRAQGPVATRSWGYAVGRGGRSRRSASPRRLALLCPRPDRAAPTPAESDPTKFHLAAPFERDARKWLALKWTDIHSGKKYGVTTSDYPSAILVRVKSLRDVLEGYRTHPEPKSCGSEGDACGRGTVGLLMRRPVHATSLTYLGKESNRVEEVEVGLVHSWSDVLSSYVDPEAEWREKLLPKLHEIPRALAAQLLQLTERAVTALRSERARPSGETRSRLRAL
jgi:hypothetical protein